MLRFVVLLENQVAFFAALDFDRIARVAFLDAAVNCAHALLAR